MAKGAYQAGPGRGRGLRATQPRLIVRTQRVRLALAVADSEAEPLGETVVSPASAAAVARAVIGDDATECVLAIFLDARQRVTGYAEVARGTLNAARLTARDVLVPALLHNAHSVVVAHNHPSGEATPSYADRSVTTILREAARIVGVQVTDHVIVTQTGHFSFASAGGWS
jgi:DNA repair protein RadC